MKKYGKTTEEDNLEKMIVCRDIVKEVLDFGVSEKQKLQIIYLLAMELENRDVMLKIKDITNNDKEEIEEKKIITI